MWWTLDKNLNDVTVPVPITNLELSSAKIIEDIVLDGLNVGNNVIC